MILPFLTEAGINLYDWRLGKRSDAYGAKEWHALVIETRDIKSETWQDAAQKIAGHAVTSGLTGEKLKIEICNSDRMLYNTSSTIQDNPSLLTDIDSITEEVLQVVREMLGSAWTSIAFHSRTPHHMPSLKMPTIMVFCQEGTVCNFDLLLTRLVATTNLTQSNIEFEILPGKLSLCHWRDGEPIDLRPFVEKPFQGASIATSGNKTRAGTLGGCFQLNLPNQPPIPCFLTCYHVIRSTNSNIAQNEDINGIPLQLPGCAEVEYPASLDTSAARHFFKNSPSDLKKIDNMIKNAVIGRVIAASGHRTTPQNRKLDWALVEIKPLNWRPTQPIPASTLPMREFPHKHNKYHLSEASSLQHFGRAQPGDWAAKKGRTSGWTTGAVNGKDRICNWNWNWPDGKGETSEMEIMGAVEAFAEPGDSGSLVHNKEGELVGLLFGKDCNTSGHDSGFACHIRDIQDDVELMTGGGVLSL
ncbi:hypothetical protein MMC06_001246 [Schaereria dolodes]|nr:hypothetical protein [Schaereria dolodes]